MPPIEDAELIQRIRATNAGDKANDLSAWSCRRCKKSKGDGSRATTSTGPSREHTVSSDSTLVSPRSSVLAGSSSSSTPNPSSQAIVAPKVECPHEQPLSASSVGVHRVDDHVRNKKNGIEQSAKPMPSQRTLSAKRTKSSGSPLSIPSKCPHGQPPSGLMQSEDSDVKMSDAASTEFTGSREAKKTPSETPLISQRVAPRNGDLRQFLHTVPVNPSEDGDQMDVETSPPAASTPIPQRTFRVLDTVSSDNQMTERNSVGEQPPMDTETAAKKPEVRFAHVSRSQPQVNEDVDMEHVDMERQDAGDGNDSDDLYGPPVERHIIRILPSLAEELREQHRQVTEKSKRAPLAPDWIMKRHSGDPRWVETPNRAKGQKHSKPLAKRRGENGIDVKDLMWWFTAKSWIQEHKS
ncbi:hypothetical protein BS17DRAFT_786297 [Gyrodon lividus]|nr:hypothetical protein BS17DRAFT_786297 [Gyrodon lividus]